MASVTLDRMWVNLASNPSQYLTLSHAKWTGQDSITGDFRQYGPGRVRQVLSGGSLGTQSFSFLTEDLSPVVLLKAWKGRTVCLRDHRGRREFASFLAVNEDDISTRLTQVSVSFTRVSFDESV
jgi:hypothetical protein